VSVDILYHGRAYKSSVFITLISKARIFILKFRKYEKREVLPLTAVNEF